MPIEFETERPSHYPRRQPSLYDSGYDVCTMFLAELVEDPLIIVNMLKQRFAEPEAAFRWLLKPHMLLWGMPPVSLVINGHLNNFVRLLHPPTTIYLN
jgi:hypothetical protein